jgi:acyl-CoA:acyl-CoA alkyltransferase
MGNTTFRHDNAALLSVAHTEAPVVVPSDQFDEWLTPALKRLRLPKGTLQRIAGIQERRWWSDDLGPREGVVRAAREAMTTAEVEPGQIDLMINTSVWRPHLEPSVAVGIHNALGLPSSAMNFDITNACLGFVNGMTLAANMIDAGQIRYALIVDAEGTRDTHLSTIENLNHELATREDFNNQFATLTLGSGAAAAVIGPGDRHPSAHPIRGAVSRAGTEWHELCVGSIGDMRTDTKALLENGLDLVVAAWEEALADGWDFRGMDRYITHQISTVYTKAFCTATGTDPAKVPVSFPFWGNVGPAALPMTLSRESGSFTAGDRILLLGVGSGLNTSMMEVTW